MGNVGSRFGPTKQMKRTCILGGGICGLISAWKREREGDEVTVVESSKRVGGVIQSEKLDGFLLDYGPNTLSLRLRKTKNLLEETEILEHAIDANPEANKRFIVRNGKLVALPTSLASFAGVGFYLSLAKPGYCSNRFCQEAKIPITNQSLTLCPEGWARKPWNIWPIHSLPGFTRQNPKLFACVIPSPPFMISNKSIALFFWAKCLVTGNQRNCHKADLSPFLRAWEN